MTHTIQIRRDTKSNWEAADPILALGELALESDTGKLKVGDGESGWSSLPYYGVGGSSITYHDIDTPINIDIYNNITETRHSFVSINLENVLHGVCKISVDGVIVATVERYKKYSNTFRVNSDLSIQFETSGGVAGNLSTAKANKDVLYIKREYPWTTDFIFNNDGTVLYCLDSNIKKVYSYSLSTPYDISTAGTPSEVLDVSSFNSNLYQFFFNNDGTVLYIIQDNAKKIHSYSLSTPYDISTAGTPSEVLDMSSLFSYKPKAFFNNDGTVLYTYDYSNKKIHSYPLSTPYDISTAGTPSEVLDVSTDNFYLNNVFFNNDGTVLYLTSGSGTVIYSYPLSTPYDISTAGTYETTIDLRPDFSSPNALHFTPDFDKFFVLTNSDDRIGYYDLVDVFSGSAVVSYST